MAQVLDTAIKAKQLPPMILVFATGGSNTRYYDSLDGSIMAETTIISELIPHIDATYRTLASRAGRAIQGCSMGGMGAFKFAFKYPELFSSTLAFAPAMLDADTMMKTDPQLIPALFNGDKTLFTKDSPAAMLVANADKLRGHLPIKIVIGSDDPLMRWSDQLHASLVKLRISHDFEIIGGVGHDCHALMRSTQLLSLRYAANYFAVPKP
jgi:endo-1,4-beta-xylanase